MQTSTKQAIEALFRANFGRMLDLAGEDRSLTPAQPEEIVAFVAQNLDSYTQTAAEVDFLQWAGSIILPVRQLYALRNLYTKYVFGGIWHLLKPNYTDLLNPPDLSIAPIHRQLTEVDEISQTTWVWAWLNMSDLLDPAITRSIANRLWTMAYWYARTWVTRRIRELKKQRRITPKKFAKLDGPEDEDSSSSADTADTGTPAIQLVSFEEAAMDEAADDPEAHQRAASPEPDDAEELTAAIENVLAFKQKKRSKESDSDTTNWGKPTVGSWLLCRDCKGHDLKRVVRIGADGYTALLSCGHARTAAAENNSLAA